MNEVEEIEAEAVAAQREADDADRLAAEVLLSYESGSTDLDQDGLADQVEARERIARFARSRVKRAQALLKEARVRARLKELQGIRSEIDDYSAKTGHKMASLMREIAKKHTDFLAMVDAHNAQLGDWGRRLNALDVPEPDHRPIPPAENAGLAHQRSYGDVGTVFAGRRSIRSLNGTQMLEQLWEKRHAPADVASLLEMVEHAADEEPLPDIDHFYRNASGAVLGQKKPWTKEEMARLELTEISREEAWGDA